MTLGDIIVIGLLIITGSLLIGSLSSVERRDPCDWPISRMTPETLRECGVIPTPPTT